MLTIILLTNDVLKSVLSIKLSGYAGRHNGEVRLACISWQSIFPVVHIRVPTIYLFSMCMLHFAKLVYEQCPLVVFYTAYLYQTNKLPDFVALVWLDLLLFSG